MRMEILNQIALLKSHLEKMQTSNNLAVGAITGLTLSIPQWIYSKTMNHYHAVLIVLLVGILTLDVIAGSSLAKKSNEVKKRSRTLYDTLVRDFIIVAICIGAYGFDYLLGTYTILFTVVTAAFILQNAYSFAGNIYVLGWTKYYPVWLFKWAKDEIESKKEKYFPTSEDE